MRIHVSDHIIGISEGQNKGRCMIANALRQLGCARPVVDLVKGTVAFTNPDRQARVTYQLPKAAIVKAIEFDRGNRPRQFDFTINRVLSSRVPSRITVLQTNKPKKPAKPRGPVNHRPALTPDNGK